MTFGFFRVILASFLIVQTAALDAAGNAFGTSSTASTLGKASVGGTVAPVSGTPAVSPASLSTSPLPGISEADYAAAQAASEQGLKIKKHFISLKLTSDRLIASWDDLNSIPPQWLTAAPDPGSSVIGYLIYLSQDQPIASSGFDRVNETYKIYFTTGRQISLTDLVPGKNYAVMVSYVVKSSNPNSAISVIGVKFGSYQWSFSEFMSIPSSFNSNSTSPKESVDLRVSLEQLYQHRQEYVGKVIQVEGYIQSRGTPAEGKFRSSKLITKPLKASDGLLTDGAYTLIVQGSAGDQMESAGIGKLHETIIGYFYSYSKPIKQLQKGWNDKSQYFFQPLEIVERSKVN